MNNGLYTVINEGISLMKNPYLDDSMLMIWLDYSRKMLDLVCNDSFLKNHYSSFLMSIVNSPDTAAGKLQRCIDYLMKLAPMI